MKRLPIFLLGMYEFRRMLTTHFDPPEINWYDWGREWAHHLTLRFFEEHCNMHDMTWAKRLTFRQFPGV